MLPARPGSQSGVSSAVLGSGLGPPSGGQVGLVVPRPWAISMEVGHPAGGSRGRGGGSHSDAWSRATRSYPSGTPTPAARGQNSRFTQMRAHRGLEDSPAVLNTLCPSQDRRPHIPRHRQQTCSPVSECDTAPWLLPSGSPALALVSFLGCNSRCPAKVLWLG